MLGKFSKSRREGLNWQGYLLGLVLVALATLLGHFVQKLFAPTNIIMIYLLCVAVSAVIGGLGPSILVSILSVITFDIFFVPPSLTFAVDDTQYIFTFVALLIVGIIISYLMSRTRSQTEEAKRREKEMTALYTLGQDLAVSTSLDAYVEAIANRIKEIFRYDVVVFLPDNQKSNTLRPYIGASNITINDNDFSAAVWSFEHQSAAGRNTRAFPDAALQCLPLVTARGLVGVIAFGETDSKSKSIDERERLLKAYIDLAAVALEGIILADEARSVQVYKATEKLQTALLNAISHDLKTPLVSVIGVLSSLQEKGIGLDEAAKENLIQVAREEADKLNHLISNLLDESRIEAGAITISRQPAEVQDLIGAALEQLGTRSGVHPIRIEIPSELPFISVDVGLIVQALVNIIDNALKYSPPDSPIEIKGESINHEVQIAIIDHGVGIPPQDIRHIFDKFYRIQRPDNVAGTGMGLSICKGIIEAHGGRIEAENHSGGGTLIRIMLPVNVSSPISG